MNTVLVTGGAGYIGSHAVKALAAAGYRVVAFDNLSAGHREAVDRVAAAAPPGAVRFAFGDIQERSLLVETLLTHRVTAVMHFAARLSVGESVKHPIEYFKANLHGSLSVLEAMAECGVRLFVFSSTAATFGEPQTTPIDESHPQAPINPYGASKLAVERALPHVERAHGIRSVALRYFNAAGADPDGLIGEDHQPEEHLIPRALAAAATGGSLAVFGTDYPTPDGTCVRDFIHVSDLADAHVLALRHLEAGGASRVFNLGNGHGVSVLDLAKSVERVTGRPLATTPHPRRPGDPAVLVASSARIMQALGWQPRFPGVDDIVRTAWRWHQAHPDGYRSLDQG